MLVARSSRATCLLLQRCWNTTLAAASLPHDVANPESKPAETLPVVDLSQSEPSPPALKRRAKRPRIFVRGRPLSSFRKDRVWKRPLAPGVLPVYDEALKIIREDSTALEAQAENLRGRISVAEEQNVEGGAEEVERMKEQLIKLKLESEINLPHVRWEVANGRVDMSRVVHRHLVEQRWRKEGALDMLMERLHQMHVIPDVLPSLYPSFQLRVAFLKDPAHIHPNTRRKHGFVDPGVYLLPEQTLQPPRLYTQVFHTDTRLYTLMMVDPDVPDEANKSYETYLHWLQPNIKLSATSPDGIVPDLNTHTLYIPPHPQRGSPYHRYTILLLPQASATEPISVPVVPVEERLGFSPRAFMLQYGLDGSLGGGAHMWREVWSRKVSRIYQDVLKQPEPRYGRVPKPDPYEEVKQKPRYV